MTTAKLANTEASMQMEINLKELSGDPTRATTPLLRNTESLPLKHCLRGKLLTGMATPSSHWATTPRELTQPKTSTGMTIPPTSLGCPVGRSELVYGATTLRADTPQTLTSGMTTPCSLSLRLRQPKTVTGTTSGRTTKSLKMATILRGGKNVIGKTQTTKVLPLAPRLADSAAEASKRRQRAVNSADSSVVTPADGLLSKWDAAHPILKRSGGATKKRMVELLDRSSAWVEDFEASAASKKWKSSTQSNYINAFVSSLKTMKVPIPNEILELRRICQRKATMQLDTQYPKCLTIAHIEQIIQRRSIPHLVKLLICVTWSLGQRVSDMLQLHSTDIQKVGKSVAITIRRGKVTPTVGPFTVFLQADLALGEDLFQHAAGCAGALFSNDMDSRIRVALKAVDIDLELRSIRRGGLTNMALRGESMQTMLTFSQHRSNGMLLRYLHNGAACMSTALEQTSVLQRTMCAEEMSVALRWADVTSRAAHTYVPRKKPRRPRHFYISSRQELLI